jgi:RND family efflux transporter MFP subunit
MVVAALAAGGIYAYQSGLLTTMTGEKAPKKKELWYCPMHPTYTSDRPGTCPICFMNLVKKEGAPEEEMAAHKGHAAGLKTFTVQELLKMKPGEICLLHKCSKGTCKIAMTEEFARLGKCPECGEDLGFLVKDLMPHGYAEVKLPPEKQQVIGIKTAKAEKSRVVKTVRTVGRIAYDPVLYQAEQEYVQAVQSLRKAEMGQLAEVKEQAEKLVDSARFRLKLSGLTDELIEEIEAAGKPDRSLLYSEAGGKAWLYAPIYEYEMPLVKVGDKVEVDVPAVTGKKFEGTIRAIDPVVDPITRSVKVRALLENPDGVLKPEMYVNATLRIDLGEILQVPEEAVFVTGEQNIVFVQKDGTVFEPRNVVLGTKAEGRYEIKSGLGEGEVVVTSGNFLVDSESRLKAALEGITEGGEHRHGA